MPQEAATGVVLQASLRVLTDYPLMKHPDRPQRRTLETELGRVVQDQKGLRLGPKPIPGGLKMAGQNRFFPDALIGQKPISGFGVRPVLTDQRDAFADPL